MESTGPSIRHRIAKAKQVVGPRQLDSQTEISKKTGCRLYSSSDCMMKTSARLLVITTSSSYDISANDGIISSFIAPHPFYFLFAMFSLPTFSAASFWLATRHQVNHQREQHFLIPVTCKIRSARHKEAKQGPLIFCPSSIPFFSSLHQKTECTQSPSASFSLADMPLGSHVGCTVLHSDGPTS